MSSISAEMIASDMASARGRLISKRENERILIRAHTLLRVAGRDADEAQLHAAAAEDNLIRENDRAAVIARAIQIQQDASVRGRHLDPALVSVTPLETREAKPRTRSSNASFEALEQRQLTKDRKLIKPAAKTRPVKTAARPAPAPNGKAGSHTRVPKTGKPRVRLAADVRGRIREYVRARRLDVPAPTSRVLHAEVLQKFGVEMSEQNFWITYWRKEKPAALTVADGGEKAAEAEPRAPTTNMDYEATLELLASVADHISSSNKADVNDSMRSGHLIGAIGKLELLKFGILKQLERIGEGA